MTEGLIKDGRKTRRGEFPWHVGLYLSNGREYEQICGGSIIYPNIVITGEPIISNAVPKYTVLWLYGSEPFNFYLF